MSTLLNDCPECGRRRAKDWVDLLSNLETSCGVHLPITPDVSVPYRGGPLDACAKHTIVLLKSRIAELEKQLPPRLRIWELSGGDVWCVALTEEECWGYLEDQHGNTDEVTELKEDGSGWTALPDDKKISLYVDSDGDVCGLDDGAPCNMPCWVWAARHGAGFLGETG